MTVNDHFLKGKLCKDCRVDCEATVVSTYACLIVWSKHPLQTTFVHNYRKLVPISRYFAPMLDIRSARSVLRTSYHSNTPPSSVPKACRILRRRCCQAVEAIRRTAITRALSLCTSYTCNVGYAGFGDDVSHRAFLSIARAPKSSAPQLEASPPL